MSGFTITCQSCGASRDIRIEKYCTKCVRRFHERTPPNRMLKTERVKELRHLTETWWTNDIEEGMKEQRLRELVGRRVPEGTTFEDMIKDVENQTGYPGVLPSGYHPQSRPAFSNNHVNPPNSSNPNSSGTGSVGRTSTGSVNSTPDPNQSTGWANDPGDPDDPDDDYDLDDDDTLDDLNLDDDGGNGTGWGAPDTTDPGDSGWASNIRTDDDDVPF